MPAPISGATSQTIAFAIAFSIITALHIVLGELAPKTVALQYPEQMSLIVAKPTELFLRLFRPFIRVLNGMGWAVVRMFGMKAASGHGGVHSEEELKMLVTASQQAGVLEEEEEQMLHRVFHFAEFTASEMMVPRTEMTAVSADAPMNEVVDTVWRGRHTSLPVYRGELDDIVGIMLVPDLVRALASPPVNFSVAAIAREALTVPETMKADELLRQMRRHRTHQAIVIDEYGGTAGLVTFERVMERIVGELGGDFGTGASNPIRQLPDGSAEVDGLALVTDINEQFGLEIDEETYTTLGGFMLGASAGARRWAMSSRWWTHAAGGSGRRPASVACPDHLTVQRCIPLSSPPAATSARLRSPAAMRPYRPSRPSTTWQIPQPRERGTSLSARATA